MADRKRKKPAPKAGLETKVEDLLLNGLQNFGPPPKSAKFGMTPNVLGSGHTVVFIHGTRLWAWNLGHPLQVQGIRGTGYNTYAAGVVAALVDAKVLTEEEQSAWLDLQDQAEDKRKGDEAIQKLHEEARRLGYSLMKNLGDDHG